MIRKALLFATATMLVLGIGAFARSQSADDALDPVKVAPDSHKLAFENAFIRVLDVHVKPGAIEKRHRHSHGISVYFTDWDAKATVDGKPPQVHHRKRGTFAWSEPLIHTVENVGTTEGHILRIELKH